MINIKTSHNEDYMFSDLDDLDRLYSFDTYYPNSNFDNVLSAYMQNIERIT